MIIIVYVTHTVHRWKGTECQHRATAFVWGVCIQPKATATTLESSMPVSASATTSGFPVRLPADLTCIEAMLKVTKDRKRPITLVDVLRDCKEEAKQHASRDAGKNYILDKPSSTSTKAGGDAQSASAPTECEAQGNTEPQPPIVRCSLHSPPVPEANCVKDRKDVDVDGAPDEHSVVHGEDATAAEIIDLGDSVNQPETKVNETQKSDVVRPTATEERPDITEEGRPPSKGDDESPRSSKRPKTGHCTESDEATCQRCGDDASSNTSRFDAMKPVQAPSPSDGIVQVVTDTLAPNQTRPNASGSKDSISTPVGDKKVHPPAPFIRPVVLESLAVHEIPPDVEKVLLKLILTPKHTCKLVQRTGRRHSLCSSVADPSEESESCWLQAKSLREKRTQQLR